jgi:hypothetical protein
MIGVLQGASVEEHSEVELPEANTGLEVARLSFVRPTSSKGSAKGESGFEDDVGWSNADRPTHGSLRQQD